MLRRQRPGVPEPKREAMAAELNGRGMPYRFDSLDFPPGVWVPITAEQAQRLQWLGWATIREAKPPEEAGNG